LSTNSATMSPETTSLSRRPWGSEGSSGSFQEPGIYVL
jgi:hypothetical protein